METEERRNSTGEIEGEGIGVGVRQEELPLPVGGGEYLDICTPCDSSVEAFEKISRNPTIDEYQRAGLNRMWLDIAELLGPEIFLQMWQVMESHRVTGGDRGPYIPHLHAFTRYRRNKIIREWGLDSTPEKIADALELYLREKVSARHVARILKRR